MLSGTRTIAGIADGIAGVPEVQRGVPESILPGTPAIPLVAGCVAAAPRRRRNSSRWGNFLILSPESRRGEEGSLCFT
jgi:hypothetical protein